MTCKRCGSKVLFEVTYGIDDFIELFCIKGCHRWILDRWHNSFTLWLGNKANKELMGL